MSLINKMLQDLDRRNAMGTASGPIPTQQVRAVSAPGRGHEWFWRTLAVLALVAVGWVGWVAYQMRPVMLATELALKVDGEAQKKAVPVQSVKAPAAAEPAVPVPAPLVTAAAKEPAAPSAEAQPNPAPPELFKLALSIDRPIPMRVAKPAAKARPEAALKKDAVDAGASRVSKLERPRTTVEEAEARFRNGVVILNQGRITDAQGEFAAALSTQPGHEAARQALIAIQIERRHLEEARRLLEEGLALNPAQTQFAAVLARVLVERGDYRGAASVLGTTQNSGADDADYQLLFGAVLQRLGRHAEAIEAFQRAASIAAPAGTTWVALGISLEATGRRIDALQAYRRSLGAGPLAQDVRAYAESRIRVLN